jgi:hypothetical protein
LYTSDDASQGGGDSWASTFDDSNVEQKSDARIQEGLFFIVRLLIAEASTRLAGLIFDVF